MLLARAKSLRHAHGAAAKQTKAAFDRDYAQWQRAVAQPHPDKWIAARLGAQAMAIRWALNQLC